MNLTKAHSNLISVKFGQNRHPCTLLHEVNRENNYYDEIDEILSSQYIIIGPGEKKVPKFLPERGIAKVEKMYNGEPTEKCRFIVIDPNSGSNAEKSLTWVSGLHD